MSESITDQNTVPNSKSNNNHEYALWYTRAAASIIDNLIVSFSCGILFFPIGIVIALITRIDSPLTSTLIQTLSFLFTSLILYCYYGYFLSKSGMTPGLKFLGIKVTKEDGSLLTFGQGILRTFLFGLLSIINIIMILASVKKQGVHDLAVGSITVKENENTSRAKWILGLNCGCGCLSIIALFVASILGISALNTAINSKSMLNKIDTMNNQKPSEEKNFDYSNPNVKDESPTQKNEVKETDNTFQNDFYKACINANKNPNVDLSNYCVCAAKEYAKGSSLDQTVQNCKNLIKLK